MIAYRNHIPKWFAAKGDIHAIEPEDAPLMLEVLREVALQPYPDSDLASLLNTLRHRANLAIAKATGAQSSRERN